VQSFGGNGEYNAINFAKMSNFWAWKGLRGERGKISPRPPSKLLCFTFSLHKAPNQINGKARKPG